MNIERWLKWRRPPSQNTRLREIKEKFSLGRCHVCQAFPIYKVTYHLPDIMLIEYYCEKHEGYIGK